jgi:type II secretory pathway pseudopilin PulG
MILRAMISKARAFTVVELNIVVLILLLAAAFVIPSILSIQKSRAIKDLEGNVARLPIEAQNASIKSQLPVTLQLQGTSLLIQETPVTGSPTTVKEVDLGQNLTIAVAQLNGKTVDSGSWIWHAYPDGTTDVGGLQFSEGSLTRSLVIYADGSSNWTNTELPDISQQQWPAGQLLQRVQ